MKRNWEYKKLGDVCVSELGKTLNQSKDTGSLQPYLCAVNVQWDSLDFTTLKQARFEEDELERYSVQKNDLLVCEGGDVGRAAIWNQEKPMLYQNALHRLRFSNNCNPRFYLFCLKHLKNKGVLDGRYAKGVTIKHLVKSALLSIQVPVPPLDEQSRIVAELDLLTGIIDKQNAQLKELDNLAQAIFYDMFGDPIENPKGWEVKKLGDVCSVVNGLVNPNEEPFCNYPHIGGANIQSNTGVFVDVKLAKDEGLISGKYLFDESMILYSKIRPNLNKVALPSFKGICSADMYPLITNTDVANKYYIKFSITHKKFIEYAVSHSGRANIPKINRDALLAYDLPLPPLAFQQSFAEKIQSIEKQKEAIRSSIADTQKLLDYTMDKYFG